jgi:uncharacterized membrane protein
MNYNNRIQSVDIGRGFAIFCMIAAHISVTYWVINGIGSMLAAPFFLLISGISFEFFMESRIQKKITTHVIFSESFSKSVLIYTIPLIPYIAVCLLYPASFPFQLIHWGVFQVIAVGYIIGFFLHQNWKLKVAAIFSIFILTEFIQIYLFQVLGFLLSDFAPVLPWLAYFILGQLIYDVYQKQPLSSSKLLLVSSIILISSIIIFNFSHIPFIHTSRAQIPVFLLLSGIFFFIQSVFIVLVDRLHKCEYLLNPLERIGKIAFTSYYLQFPLIFGAVFIITKFNLPSAFVIPFIFIIIGILAILEKYWEEYNFIFGFEWIIRKGSTLLNEWIISNCYRAR